MSFNRSLVALDAEVKCNATDEQWSSWSRRIDLSFDSSGVVSNCRCV